MVITKIEKQKKKDGRFSVFLDGEFAFGIDGVDLLYYKLEEGGDISPSLYDEMIERIFFVKARDKAIKYLGLSLRTERDVRQRLEREDYPEGIIDDVIALLMRYGYIDDEKFTKAFILSRTKQNIGRNRIFQELMQKGIKRDIIFECFEDGLEKTDEIKRALEAIRKKMKGFLPEDQREKRRLTDYLARRGFAFEVIKEAYKLYAEGEDGFDGDEWPGGVDGSYYSEQGVETDE